MFPVASSILGTSLHFLGTLKPNLRVILCVDAGVKSGPLFVLLSLLEQRECIFFLGDGVYVVMSKPLKFYLRSLCNVRLGYLIILRAHEPWILFESGLKSLLITYLAACDSSSFIKVI